MSVLENGMSSSCNRWIMQYFNDSNAGVIGVTETKLDNTVYKSESLY